MDYFEFLDKWEIIRREDWLTEAWIGGSPAFQPRSITHMTKHYMGGDDIDCSNTPRLLNNIQRSYRVSRGYDFGYLFADDADGRLYEGRGFRARAASDGASGTNIATVSCLSTRPNIADDLVLPQQEDANRRLMAAVREWTGRPVEHWVKHRDVFPGTACCGVPIGKRVDAGELEPRDEPDPDPPEDDMTPEQEAKIDALQTTVNDIMRVLYADDAGTGRSMYFASQETRTILGNLQPGSGATPEAIADELARRLAQDA